MPRALITGVCGFIGSHLAERLIGSGWIVDGLDHHPDHSNLANVHDRIGLMDSGMSLEKLAEWHVPSGYYDAIFHLAGRVGPAAVIEDPLSMLIEHTQHAIAVCELAARTHAVVVLASSSEVYQWNENSPMREDDALTIGPSHLPRCGYAISKLNMEHIGLAYWRQRSVRVIVARLFNVVGPRQRDRFVLPIFAKAALRGEPLQVHGDGSQIRTFTHVRDTVEALMRLAGTPAANGEVINLAARAPCLSIGAVAARLVAHASTEYAVPRQSPIVCIPYAATGDSAWEHMRVRRPDVSKLERLTGVVTPDRGDEIISDVCTDWAVRLGVARRVAARRRL